MRAAVRHDAKVIEFLLGNRAIERNRFHDTIQKGTRGEIDAAIDLQPFSKPLHLLWRDLSVSRQLGQQCDQLAACGCTVVSLRERDPARLVIHWG
jgi:hypothetical protein